MSDEKDNNYISVGQWMGMIFIQAIPLIGMIMVFVWAFSGENQSRKNYYRAILCWILLIVLLVVGGGVALNMTGHMQDFQQRLQHLQSVANKPV